MSVVTTLSASTSLLRNSNPPVVSSNVVDDAYVLAVVDHPNSHSYALALALSGPDSVISLRDPATLTEKIQWHAHRPISQLKRNGKGDLVSCGKDGILNQWDERTKQGCSLTLTAPNYRPLLSFDCSPSNNLVAAGCEYQSDEAPILFWDTRFPGRLLRTHASTHSDDITNLAFISRLGLESLVSSSTDGLLSLSNPIEDDEDEAVVSVANWGTSISKMGFISKDDGLKLIWTASDMETLAIWDMELDLFREFGDVRNPRATLPGVPRDWKIDYVVDILSSSPITRGPLLLGGTNQGGVGLIDLTGGANPTSEWRLSSILSGHEGVVRSALWDQNRRVLVTGGEDSKLNIWKIEQNQDHMDVDVEEAPVRKRGIEGDGKSNYKKPRV